MVLVNDTDCLNKELKPLRAIESGNLVLASRCWIADSDLDCKLAGSEGINFNIHN